MIRIPSNYQNQGLMMKRQRCESCSILTIVAFGVFGLLCVGVTLLLVNRSSCFVDLPDGRRYLPGDGLLDDRKAEQIRESSLSISRKHNPGGAAASQSIRRKESKASSERNCSVVGNDSSMRKAGLGRLIDETDAVYRMNFAPLLEFAPDVGMRTYTQCLNPEKLRLLVRTNREFVADTGEKPRVVVVGDQQGEDPITGAKGPCVEYSPGGSCVKRVDSKRAQVMAPEVQDIAEKLLDTLQEKTSLGDAVPSTGLYCLTLALMECTHVDVYGMGVGTINHKDMSDLEYFKDPHFHGWDARHDVEMERALLRILSSPLWSTPLTAGFGTLNWHNPLKGIKPGANDVLIAESPCTSGIHC